MSLYRDRREYVAPPCFHCGAPSVVGWQEIVAGFGASLQTLHAVSQLTCSARCLDADPEGYKVSLAAHLKKEGM